METIINTNIEISEPSSSFESITKLIAMHRKALRNASRCHIPFRDQDEFSAKLTTKVANVPVSSSESGLTFVRHNIYTIEELTEDSALSISRAKRSKSSEEELMARLEKIKQITTAARTVQRPVSRRSTDIRPPTVPVPARLIYQEEISAKFELMNRFLKDQQEVKQDPIPISSDESVRQRYLSSRSASEKNRVIGSLCCSCISRQ
ncbi:uncharacterized protein LOC128740889 [Sabethes cyaneus]|uniref:uncharacterized protein LOC128740889 n=1 Tax=Sabethes cyaneus TaxID=53552 RepID=UPI00237E5DE0|nr:uncharacterized protein LOC128740889 [Sabethes cyaneus]